jgi:hypothetical protein
MPGLQLLEISRESARLLGWSLVLAGFLSGALLGLRFHDERFLGGYASLRRRLVRLGHIACVALGVLLVEVARAKAELGGSTALVGGFALGALLMPATCFLVAWRPRLRPLFVAPVVALVVPLVALLAQLAARVPNGASP